MDDYFFSFVLHLTRQKRPSTSCTHPPLNDMSIDENKDEGKHILEIMYFFSFIAIVIVSYYGAWGGNI